VGRPEQLSAAHRCHSISSSPAAPQIVVDPSTKKAMIVDPVMDFDPASGRTA